MKKDRRRSWWIILVLIVAAAIFAGYYLAREKPLEKVNEPMITRAPAHDDVHTRTDEARPDKTEFTHGDNTEFTHGDNTKFMHEDKEMETQEREVTRQPVQEDPCKAAENQLRDFFLYLNGRSYIQNISKGLDSYYRFERIINKLSSDPPVPSGEGLNIEIMIKNIFFFCRVLGREDIRFIKAVLQNEADTLELNLEMFYRWLMLGDRCPDPERRIHLSFDMAYHYAGFFLNTIGGKASLSRRALSTRILVSYYCLLILHEADKRGKNRYGIDVLPKIDPIMQEIRLLYDLRYQETYVEHLANILNYYQQRR
jgi:hypothetical protein